MKTAPELIITESIILKRLDDEIIQISPNPDWKQAESLEQAKVNHAATIKMADGKTFSLICFLGKTSINKEARDYYKSQNPEAKKVAFVVTNFFQKIVGTIFTGVSKLPVPTKLFSSEEEALKWLRLPD